MRKMSRSHAPILLAALLVAGMAEAQAGEEEKRLSNKTEFSLVATNGNSQTGTLGFKNEMKRIWQRGQLRFDAGAILSVTEDVTITAVGPDPGDFVVIEDTQRNTNAERYSLSLDYDGRISDRSYWSAGTGWVRNLPSGIEHHLQVRGSYGNLWKDGEKVSFRTEYGLTWNYEQDSTGNQPDDEKNFGGLRGALYYTHRFAKSSSYEQSLILDENLRNTDDFRADWTNGVSVGINGRLALKVSLQFLYRADPVEEEYDLEFPPGTPTGFTVLVPKEELDTLFTTGIVVDF